MREHGLVSLQNISSPIHHLLTCASRKGVITTILLEPDWLARPGDPRAFRGMSTIVSTKGLPLTSRCVILSQEVPLDATCEPATTRLAFHVLSVRVSRNGEYLSMYYPEIKSLSDCCEGDRVLVETDGNTWTQAVVNMDDAVAAARLRAQAMMPASMRASTQLERVLAAFDKLYINALDEDAFNEVRVVLNDSSDDATDDESISVDLWQTLNNHVDAFEDVQDTHADLTAMLKASRPTVPEKNG